jgi:hypothetical protein
MKNGIEDIDLVYLWVDGNDPRWQEKKRKYTGKLSDTTEANNIGRYISHDELKYSLRSAEKHVPWIRKIFIVTDNQKPQWLNDLHPKIRVVDHTEIMPADILPCFNSSVIEYFLYKIPGLAEHFLYANDDMFFNADLSPDYFFAEDGLPYVRLKKKPLGKWHHRLKALIGKKLGHYRNQLVEASLLVEKKFGKYYSGVPHHNVDAYCKTDYRKAVEDVFGEQTRASRSFRVRTQGDLSRSAYGYYFIATGRGHLRYAGRKESLRILSYKHDLSSFLDRYKPTLFCVNDSQHMKDEHRTKIKPFLEKLFPVKSTLEV